MNSALIDKLDILYRYYKKTGDIFRTRAYANAIATINTLDFEITNVSEVNKLPGIGKTMKAKIAEFLETGTIKKTEKLKSPELTPKEKVIQQLLKIHDIGKVAAERLYTQGIRSIADLEKHQDLLTKNQKIGLKYFKELEKPIPRMDITVYQLAVRYLLNKYFGKGSYRLQVTGSYSRYAASSGDVDIVIQSDNFDLEDIVSLLEKYGLISDTLALSTMKFMGIGNMTNCKLDTRHFRLDIIFVQKDEWVTSVLYFTGGKNTNVMMRAKAKKLGFTLNEHGLYHKGKKVAVQSERDIFDILDIRYLPPNKRT